MARKDSEKDSERPHYYSQFWLDVAAGRRIIGAPKPEDEEAAEPEIAEPAPQRRSRVTEVAEPEEQATIVHPTAEPVVDIVEPDAAEESDVDDLGYAGDSEEEDFEVPDLDTIEEDEDFFEGEDEEEEEDDDMSWGRGRKKKPARPTKPVAKKPGKRDPRRGY